MKFIGEVYKYHFLNILKLVLIIFLSAGALLLFILLFPVVWIKKVQDFLSWIGSLIEDAMSI